MDTNCPHLNLSLNGYLFLQPYGFDLFEVQYADLEDPQSSHIDGLNLTLNSKLHVIY